MPRGFAYSTEDPATTAEGAPKITVNFYNKNIYTGGTATLVWDVENADVFYINSASNAMSGSTEYTSSTETTYNIYMEAINYTTGLSASTTVVINIQDAPEITPTDPTIIVTPTERTVTENTSAVFTYATTDAQWVEVNGSPLSTISGTYSVLEATAGTYQYTFTAYGADGTTPASQVATLYVIEDTPPPVDEELVFTDPAPGTVVYNGETFSVTVQATGDPATGTITIAQDLGAGTVSFASGTTISLTAANEGTLSGISYAMDDGTTAGVVENFSLTATMTDYTSDTLSLAAVAKYLTVTLDAATYTATADGNELTWTVYATITANDKDGVETGFDSVVHLIPISYDASTEFSIDSTYRPDSSYLIGSGTVVSYCSGDTWSDANAVAVTNDLLPTGAFSSGKCVAKIEYDITQVASNYTSADRDPNAGYASIKVTAEVVS